MAFFSRALKAAEGLLESLDKQAEETIAPAVTVAGGGTGTSAVGDSGGGYTASRAEPVATGAGSGGWNGYGSGSEASRGDAGDGMAASGRRTGGVGAAGGGADRYVSRRARPPTTSRGREGGDTVALVVPSHDPIPIPPASTPAPMVIPTPPVVPTPSPLAQLAAEVAASMLTETRATSSSTGTASQAPGPEAAEGEAAMDGPSSAPHPLPSPAGAPSSPPVLPTSSPPSQPPSPSGSATVPAPSTAGMSWDDYAALRLTLVRKDDLLTRQAEENASLTQRVSQLTAERNALAAQCAELGTQVRSLNGEADEMDGRLVAAQAKLDAAAAEITTLKAALARGKQTESRLMAQVTEAYSEMTASKAVAAALKEELQAMDPTVVDDMREKMAGMQAAVAAAQSELEAARASHAAQLGALRAENVRLEGVAESAASEAAAIRWSAQRREEELANEVSELTIALASAQRSLDDKTAIIAAIRSAGAGDLPTPPGSGSTPVAHDAAHSEQERQQLREKLIVAEMGLAAERQVSATLRVDVDGLRRQLTAAKAGAEMARKQMADAVSERDAKIAGLTATLSSLERQLEVGSVSVLQARIASLVTSIAGKQAALDRANSEVTTLQATVASLRSDLAATREREHGLQGRLQSLHEAGIVDEEAGEEEEEVAVAIQAAAPGSADQHGHGGGGAGGDTAAGAGGSGGGVEDRPLALPSFHHQLGGGGTLAQPSRMGGRGNGVASMHTRMGGSTGHGGHGLGGGGAMAPRMAQAVGAITPLSKLRPIGHNKSIAPFAEALDAVSVQLGRFLFRHPAARLCFMAYLALLHLWCLFIILFHTHALPHDAHAHTQAGTGAMPVPRKAKAL